MAEAQAELQNRGWCILPHLLDPQLIEATREQLAPALQLRHDTRQRNRVEGSNDGTLHRLLADHPSLLRVIDAIESLDPSFNWYFGGNYILNSFGGGINRKDTGPTCTRSIAIFVSPRTPNGSC